MRTSNSTHTDTRTQTETHTHTYTYTYTHTETRARAAALVTITAFGFGPLGRTGPSSPSSKFASFRSSLEGYLLALDSAGLIGRQLINVGRAFGGSITAEQLRFQVEGADQTQIEAELQRLAAAELVELDPEGSIHVDEIMAAYHGSLLLSMSDKQAISSDQLQHICRQLSINAPGKKDDRIAAIAAHFADGAERQLVLKGLGAKARSLLGRIVEIAGPRVITAEHLGLGRYQLQQVSAPRYSQHRPQLPSELAPLAELVARGIVGVAEWEGTLWIWREALPLLDVPLYRNWNAAPQPDKALSSPPTPQLPSIVSIVDRALRYWARVRPPVLKNGELRLAKTVVRSTAKALGCDEAVATLVSCLVIDLGLLLPNSVGTSGRGRDRTVDQVWLADPTLAEAWNETSQVDRWTCLVAAWCRPDEPDQQQLLCNRHLVLWELANLEPDEGYVGDHAFSRWMGDRYASLGVVAAVDEVIVDLRILGLAPPDGPLALTPLGRQLLQDPAAVREILVATATSVVIQGDMTVLVPPGLDPEIHSRLSDLAHVESSGQAELLRLDEERITKAVQAGATADDIVRFLAGVSSVPLTDSVTRLVRDAAGRADRVRLATAATVVVTHDPADLTLACSIKSAQLVAVSDTVAVSPLPLDKVRTALDRKGLAPTLAAGESSPVTARSAAADAASLRRQAEQARRLAAVGGRPFDSSYADDLDQLADKLSDPRRRLRAEGPLALTPALVASLVDES